MRTHETYAEYALSAISEKDYAKAAAYLEAGAGVAGGATGQVFLEAAKFYHGMTKVAAKKTAARKAPAKKKTTTKAKKK